MATNFAPDARSYATATYPTLVRAVQFPLPASMTTFEEAWMYLGTVEDAVFEVVNRRLPSRATWTAQQRNSYASLRLAWQDAQLRLYQFTRNVFALTFPATAANTYSEALGYPGWLPRSDAQGIELPLAPDMRSADGKRMGIASTGGRTLATLAVQYPNARLVLGFDEDEARTVCGKMYAAGLAAKFFTSLFANTPAQSPVDPAVVAREVAMNSSSNKLPYYIAGGIVACGLFYWFFLRAPKRSGTRGLGAPTRLKTLNDPVPSRYNLEIP